MKMKQVLLTQKGDPETLQIIETEIPEPQAGQVRLKVLAAGVAFADVMMRHGQYPGAPRMPFTPGYDICGVIEKLGTAVKDVEIGRMAVALTFYGGYTQYICLSVEDVVIVPDGLDPAETTSLVLNYGTAYQMLYRLAQIQPTEKILVHGAAGGVGTALLQLGALDKLEMYGTASKAKHALVTHLGAIPIDYTTEDFVARIKTFTEDGVDAVFDAIAGSHLVRSWQTLRRGGRLVQFGFYNVVKDRSRTELAFARMWTQLQWWSLLPNGKKALFYNIGWLKKQHPEWLRADITQLVALLAEHKIHPLIAARLPIDEVARAHTLLEQAHVQGKFVLLPHEI